jgi:hypothetical protein
MRPSGVNRTKAHPRRSVTRPVGCPAARPGSRCAAVARHSTSAEAHASSIRTESCGGEEGGAGEGCGWGGGVVGAAAVRQGGPGRAARGGGPEGGTRGASRPARCRPLGRCPRVPVSPRGCAAAGAQSTPPPSSRPPPRGRGGRAPRRRRPRRRRPARTARAAARACGWPTPRCRRAGREGVWAGARAESGRCGLVAALGGGRDGRRWRRTAAPAVDLAARRRLCRRRAHRRRPTFTLRLSRSSVV